MQADYAAFIDRLIQKYEGGYGWNAGDPGGPTNFGITCFDLAEHRGQKMTSMATWAPIVRAMTLREAEDIYRTKYATAVHFDTQLAGVDCCLLDYAVNSGVGRPLRVVAALPHSVKTTADLINAVCDERLRFMHAIRGGSSWTRFGHGWQRRVDDVRAYSLHLAGGSIGVAPVAPDLSKVATPKARHVARSATGATAGGVIPAGAAAHAAGLPWYGVVAAVAVVVVAGVSYEAYEARRVTAANNLVHV